MTWFRHRIGKLCKVLRQHRTLLWVWTLWVVVALYVAEAATGLVLEKSIALSPVPPHSTQHHTAPDYAVTYHYNNIGLRSPDFDPNVTYDALLIGDSFMFGSGVEDNQTVTGFLTASGLRVLSAAEPATNPPQYLQKIKVLTAWGLKSRALVVGLFIGNDFQGLAGKDISALLSASFADAAEPYTWRSFLALQRVRYVISSARAKWLENALFPHEFERRMKFYDDWSEFFAQGDPALVSQMRNVSPWNVDGDEFLRLTEINDETIAKGTALLEAIAHTSPAADKIVVLLPIALFYQRQYGGAYEQYMQYLRERLSTRYHVVDMHAFGNAGLYLPHDGHLNVAGNRCVAAAIEAALKRQTPLLCRVPIEPK